MSYAGIFTDKNNVDHPVTAVLYGTCATEAATAAKVVTCTDFDTLMTGVTIRVKFTNGNSAANPTININSTGAKSVFRFGSTAPVGDNSWEAGAVVELTYDGTSFFMTGSDDIGTLYSTIDTKQSREDFKDVIGWDNSYNQWDESVKNGYYDVSNGAYYYAAGQLCSNDFIPVKPNTNYYGYKGYATGAGLILFYDANKQYISYLEASSWVNKTFTTPQNAYYATIDLETSYGPAYRNDVSINYPSTATTYEPYHAQVGVQAQGLADAIGWDNHKNLLELSLSDIKSIDSDWSWSQNNATNNGITVSVLTDDYDRITGFIINGTATGNTYFTLRNKVFTDTNATIFNGCPSGGGSNKYGITFWTSNQLMYIDYGEGISVPPNAIGNEVYIYIANGYTASNLGIYPMIRKASDTDPTFQPYHPVIGEAVEELFNSHLLGINKIKINDGGIAFPFTPKQDGIYLLTYEAQNANGGHVNMSVLADGINWVDSCFDAVEQYERNTAFVPMKAGVTYTVSFTGSGNGAITGWRRIYISC